jgi:exodeoxyribonuclease VII large subunit
MPSSLFEPTEALTVSAASALVRGQVEALGNVTIMGELSAPKVHSSGHFYADLKDESSTLAVVAWRSTVERWTNIPHHGQLVEVRGKLTTYPARSSYQLQITSLQPAGQGALLAQLEALKQKLQAEGLFAAERKRSLPFLPARVGIVTSPTGAVIADMLARIQARCPRPVLLAPCAVQGPEAPAQIAAAIEALNRLPVNQRPELLIVARGGGSLEDLMAFNSEAVVRAVAGSGIPVISGVGHEPDITLCDFAADLRAATPTAAAEAAVPVRADLLAGLATEQAHVQRLMGQLLETLQWRIGTAKRLLPDPTRLLLQASARLNELTERLYHSGPQALQQAKQRLENLQRVLAAHHPEAPLQRGYALLWREGQVVGAESAAGPLEIQFATTRRRGTLHDV